TAEPGRGAGRGPAAVRGDHGFAERAGRGGDPGLGLSGAGIAGGRMDRRGDAAAGAVRGVRAEPGGDHRGHLHGSGSARRSGAAVHGGGVGRDLLPAGGAVRGHRGGAVAAVPQALVLAIAGLALVGPLGNSPAPALQEADEREAALVTFLVTASGLSLLGVSAAFWGLVAGVIVRVVSRPRRTT